MSTATIQSENFVLVSNHYEIDVLDQNVCRLEISQFGPFEYRDRFVIYLRHLWLTKFGWFLKDGRRKGQFPAARIGSPEATKVESFFNKLLRTTVGKLELEA